MADVAKISHRTGGQRKTRPLAAPTSGPSTKNSGRLEECDTSSLAGKHQRSEKEESLPVPFARVVVRVRVSLDVIVPCGHTHCAARWSPSVNFFSEFDGRRSVHARVHRHMHLTVQFTVCLRYASICSARLDRTQVRCEPGYSSIRQPSINWDLDHTGSRIFLFDSKCQGLSNRGQFSSAHG